MRACNPRAVERRRQAQGGVLKALSDTFPIGHSVRESFAGGVAKPCGERKLIGDWAWLKKDQSLDGAELSGQVSRAGP